MANNLATTEARGKNKHRFGITRILEFFDAIKFYFIKLATDL